MVRPNQNCWLCHLPQSPSVILLSGIRLPGGPGPDGIQSQNLLMESLLSSLYNYEFPVVPSGAGAGDGHDDKENVVICCITCALNLTNLHKTRIQILKNVHANARLRVDGHVKKMMERSAMLGTTGAKNPPKIKEIPIPKKPLIPAAPVRVPNKPLIPIAPVPVRVVPLRLPEVITVEESSDTDSAAEPEMKDEPEDSDEVEPEVPTPVKLNSPDPDELETVDRDPLDLDNSPETKPAPESTDESETDDDDDEEFQIRIPNPNRPNSSDPEDDDDQEFRIQISNPNPPNSSDPKSQKPLLLHKRTRDRLLLTGRCNRPKCQHFFSKCPRYRIYRHLQTAHSEEIAPEFYCSDSDCSKTLLKYITNADFDAHFFRYHGQNSITSPSENPSSFPKLLSRCGFKFIIDFHSGKKQKHVKRPLSCPICKESWITSEPGITLRLHMEVVHGQEPKYPCPICGMPAKTPAHVAQHLRTHRGADEKKRDLEQLNAGKEKVTCEYCGVIFTANGIQAHINRIHAPKTNAQRKTYPCEVCNRTYNCRYTLKKHIQNVHAPPKPVYYYKFTCSRCNQGFVRKLELMNHQLSCCDEKERPFPCHQCPKRFKIKPNLSEHLITMHKMDRIEVRELLYPGLPVPEWWGIRSNKPNRKWKKRGADVGADGSSQESKSPRRKRQKKKPPEESSSGSGTEDDA